MSLNFQQQHEPLTKRWHETFENSNQRPGSPPPRQGLITRTVLPLVIHPGMLSQSKLAFHTVVYPVKFFNQNPCTMSGPGAIQFGTFPRNCVAISMWMDRSARCGRSTSFFSFFYCSTSVLCSTPDALLELLGLFWIRFQIRADFVST